METSAKRQNIPNKSVHPHTTGSERQPSMLNPKNEGLHRPLSFFNDFGCSCPRSPPSSQTTTQKDTETNKQTNQEAKKGGEISPLTHALTQTENDAPHATRGNSKFLPTNLSDNSEDVNRQPNSSCLALGALFRLLVRLCGFLCWHC